MWTWLVRFILWNRLRIIIALGLLTIYMAYNAFNVQLSYELARMLPSSDSTYVEYTQFKERFGEDGSVIAVGVVNKKMFELENYNAFYDLCKEIRDQEGIEEVVSVSRLITLHKNDSTNKFDFLPLTPEKPKTQAEIDSIKQKVFSTFFYKELLFNEKTNSYLIAITLDKKKVNDKSRTALVHNIIRLANEFKEKTNSEIHLSGLPYIRTLTSEKVRSEIILFVIISLIIAAIIMMLFFKSSKVVISSMIIVFISIIFTLGTITLLGFKITILTGVIPSLIIIIAIENCIFLTNKYHWEYRNHGNKIKALSRMVRRIGFATLMTNITTATGFATFIFTSNEILREFGIVASINIVIEFILSLVLIPIIYSYQAPPKEKHTQHIEGKRINFIVDVIKNIVFNRRKLVYTIASIFLLVCIYGMTRMKTSGKVVDDLRSDDPVYVDLKFFEKNFNGVMPFEISIDTKRKNGVMKMSTINKINELQEELAKHPEFSKPLSLAEFLKFAKQAFYNGDTTMYSIPDNMEKDFILSYFPGKEDGGKKNLIHAFLDSNRRFTRISVQMADIGTKEMNLILSEIKPKIDSIFDSKKFDVTVTGNSVVYTKGTDFLIDNLVESVLLGIILISLLVAVVFSSYRMVIITMICNLIPLTITAAIMGFANIPVKPSTLIVFSVALGIAIDNALLFLSKYRHELKITNGDIPLSIMKALEETGISMIYSSIVLVLGFGVFMISEFGGTMALGMLISITLFLALFYNIIVLPSLILSLNKIITTRSFKQPIIEIYDVEVTEDIIEENLLNEENNDYISDKSKKKNNK